MKQNSNKKIRNIFALALLGSTVMLTSCGSIIDQHGYVAQAGAVEDITIGMGKREVNSILGSPSVTTTANGLSYYYISSKQSRFALIGTPDDERKVVAVHFGRNARVSKIANYGLQDGVLIDFISQTTPTYKKDLNFIQQLLGGGVKPNAGGGTSFARGNGAAFN
ncbi:MAG: outer membrane protein assembly factor BamE [Hyphomicrobiales bacterium]